jgi:hypothetical protein
MYLLYKAMVTYVQAPNVGGEAAQQGGVRGRVGRMRGSGAGASGSGGRGAGCGRGLLRRRRPRARPRRARRRSAPATRHGTLPTSLYLHTLKIYIYF